MEKNKLDKLFDEARSSAPIVSFDEASQQFDKKSSEYHLLTNNSAKWKYVILTVCTLLIIGGGTYLFLNTSSDETPMSPSEKVMTPAEDSVIPEATNKAESGTVENESSISEDDATSSATVKKEAEPAPLKNKITHEDKKTGNYILENQTVNIHNEAGQFKVYFRDGEIDKITLNNNELKEGEWSAYSEVMEEAKNAVSKMGVDRESAGSRKFVEYLFSTLKQKGLIKNNLATVKLSNGSLLIDGHEADSAVHHELLQQFKVITGEELGNRTLYFN